MLSDVSAFYARSLTLDFLCSPREQTAYVTHVPWDCASYVICLNGQAIPTPCPAGKLYASASRNSKCEPASLVDASRCHHQIWNYIRTICQYNPTGVVHDSQRCAQYFDCTVTNDNTAMTLAASDASSLDTATYVSGVVTRAPVPGGVQQVDLMEFLLECPYPTLFSTVTGSCQDHRAVTCGERDEPKEPCDYLQYLQRYDCTGFDCAVCRQHHPSCARMSNGQHPVPSRSDAFMECQEERTVNIFLVTATNRQSSVPLAEASRV